MIVFSYYYFELFHNCVYIDDKESNENDIHIGDAPHKGLEFSIHNDAYIIYNSHATKNRFGIHKKTFNRSRSDPSKIIS